MHRVENLEAETERRAAEWRRGYYFTSQPLNQASVRDLARRSARPASSPPARRSVAPPVDPLASLFWHRGRA